MAPVSEADFIRVINERRERLREEIGHLDEERAYLQVEYARREGQLREKVERLEKELTYVEQILALRNGGPAAPSKQLPAPTVRRRRIEDEVCDLLTSEGHGLHYKEILARLSEAGVVVPGKNPAASLVARLVRDKRFSRPEQRGFYALRKWAPDAADVGSKGRSQVRSRRRKVSGRRRARPRHEPERAIP